MSCVMLYFVAVQLYAVCVYVSGSHRIIETDYDDVITVVSSGGWGGRGGRMVTIITP